ncbi:MAG: helicase [Tistrella sp.]|nr:helicase [Tistrella sp.]
MSETVSPENEPIPQVAPAPEGAPTSPASDEASVFRGSLPLATKLDRARMELLDLSARNRLLNLPQARRSRMLDIVDERGAEIYRLLVGEGRRFTFLPGRETEEEKVEEGGAAAGDTPALAQPEDEAVDARGLVARHTDTKLQTRLGSEGLQRRLLDLHLDARTLEEEQGVNILFLALGTLVWTDPAAGGQLRRAPLVLVPVQLERGSATERFRLAARPEDVATNLSLEAFLDREHGITLPAFDAEAEGETDPFTAYVAAVAEAVHGRKGWEVRPDEVILGFFSFSKFLMYRDLDPAVWPADAPLTDRPLIRGLLDEGFGVEDVDFDEDVPVDPLIGPEDLVHIVDADASQTLAIHEARRGRDLVIQGPPGTGKSQTIANVIAAAVADGKTVLFVAEKMAALEVVKRRLDQAGVGEVCLELHSHKATKRAVLEDLKRSWELGTPRIGDDETLFHRLGRSRAQLNAHAERLHRALEPTGLSPYQVIGELVRLRAAGVAPADFDLAEAAPGWTAPERTALAATLDDLARRIEAEGPPASHPWRGVGLDAISPLDADRRLAEIAALERGLAGWRAEAEVVAGLLDLPAPATLDGSSRLLARAERLAAAPDLPPAVFLDPVWSVAADDVAVLVETGLALRDQAARLRPGLAPAADGLATADLQTARDRLAVLPAGFDAAARDRLARVVAALPAVIEAGSRLAGHLGLPAPETLREAGALIRCGAAVAAAPDLPAEQLAAGSWEAERAALTDLVEAVRAAHDARLAAGDRVTEAAWSTGLAEARQAIAETGGSLFRIFSGRWRRANRLVKSILTGPKPEDGELIQLLDRVIAGQAAAARAEAGDALGRAAFGPVWRGARSAPERLEAMLAWVNGPAGDAATRRTAAACADRPLAGDLAARLGAAVAAVADDLDRLAQDLGPAAPALLGTDLGGERAPLAASALAPVVAAEAVVDAAFAIPAVLAGERLAALDDLLEMRRREAVLADAAVTGRAAFGPLWPAGDRAAADWEAIARAAAWLAAEPDLRALAARTPDRAGLRGRTAALVEAGHGIVDQVVGLWSRLAFDPRAMFGETGIPDLDLDALAAHLRGWLAAPEGLPAWAAILAAARAARAAGLAPLVDRLEDGRLDRAGVMPAFEMAAFEAIWQAMTTAEPALAGFDGTAQDGLVRSFAALDRARIDLARSEVRAEHARSRPRVNGLGPVGVLRGELAKKRRHMPIRQLMSQAGPAVQALKPVFMMSPLSVAQFLEPGRIGFDLLVVDEASQIQPVDALGAIARCRQMVVVGDERQLPPTAFFARMTADAPDADEEDETTRIADVESILGLCVARGLPQRMLRWHYRSRHQSLIAVSNHEFYQDRLHVVPSPYAGEAGLGLDFVHVTDGVFETGGSGTNPAEARRVAEAVIAHARTTPERSLGVATFSVRQRRAILDALEALRRAHPETEDFFNAHPAEPFFVKNLENVQGDERDVIFISVAYGRNAQGYMAMRFGPVGAEGGERRLNVLISRAKRLCRVFASITDEDIDLERARGRGVAALKTFLRYARTGSLEVARRSGRPADSVFEEQVARALRARGHLVHEQVGLAGFFIDLAVVDPDRPGRYLLGIECDGAGYHAARSARDRDRLRQAVLEDHGWIIHRIWSADWFARPEGQLAAVEAAILRAREMLEARDEGRAAAAAAMPPEDAALAAELGLEGGEDEAPAEDDHLTPAYVEADPEVPAELQGMELHQVTPAKLAPMVMAVVKVEGPVHLDEVTARLRDAWGLGRAGARIQAAVRAAASYAIRRRHLVDEGWFLSLPGEPVRIRDRSAVTSAGLRKPELLPPAEIEAGLMRIAAENLGVTREELQRQLARMLGFRALSAGLRSVTEDEIRRLTERRRLVERDGLIVVAEPAP